MATELLRSVLLLVVAFLLRIVLEAIGVALDDVTFNTIVAALVAWILTNLGVEGARRAAPNTFRRDNYTEIRYDK